jgi:hypothetical protein
MVLKQRPGQRYSANVPYDRAIDDSASLDRSANEVYLDKAKNDVQCFRVLFNYGNVFTNQTEPFRNASSQITWNGIVM